MLNTIRSTYLVGLMTVAISWAAAAESDAVRKDSAQLQGEWSMVSGSADGQPMPAALLE